MNGSKWEVMYTSSTYKEMAKNYNSLVRSSASHHELESFLGHYDFCPSFVHDFFRAKFAYDSKNYAVCPGNQPFSGQNVLWATLVR